MPDPIHPGVTLSSALRERGISQARLARATGLPPSRISELVHCRRGITADMALRLGRALGPSARFWLDLQTQYDIDRAEQSVDTGAIEPLVTRPPDTGKAMMRALEDDMAARPGLYRRLADR